MVGFTTELTFGPATVGIYDPGSPARPYRTIQNGSSGLPLKLAFEGDSISSFTAGAWSWARRYMLDYPAVPAQIFALAGAATLPADNPSNNLWDRVPTVAAYNPSHLIAHMGTNDLAAHTTVNDWVTNCLDPYIARVRSYMPQVKLILGEITPTNGIVNPNTNVIRDGCNAAVRARALSGVIDGILPFGTHPVMGLTANGADTNLYADGLHPSTAGYAYLYHVALDVLDPIRLAYTEMNNPTLDLFNIGDAPLSTVLNSRGRVSGLKHGAHVDVTMTGSGTFAVGTGAQGTTGTVFNGDVITTSVTSSASNDTVVNQTITAGGTVKNLTYTTAPVSYPASTTTLDPLNKVSSVTLSGGNLLAAGTNLGSPQQVRATAYKPNNAGDCFYFEAKNLDATGSNGQLCVMDGTVPFTARYSPGGSGTYKDAGFSFYIANGLGATFSIRGVNFTMFDGDNMPAIANSDVIGFAVDTGAGKVWIRLPTRWWGGDPAIRYAGHKLTAPLAKYYPGVQPRTTDRMQINLGASAFTYPIPLGFRPFL